MQQEPEKILGCYNELSPTTVVDSFLLRNSNIVNSSIELEEAMQIIEYGTRLVHDKIVQILGPYNALTRNRAQIPNIDFIEADPKNPNLAGYFDQHNNRIVVFTGKAKDTVDRTKIFIHEYLHFLSHNARDDNERFNSSQISVRNNIGFLRCFGLDIRKGREGDHTSDYFKAFNEAVTEQLAIDILPEGFKTYNQYRELLNQVIDDAMAQKFGSNDVNGTHATWSKEQIKEYIYQCFFTGDLDGFTDLLKSVYSRHEISEQQFGLMTCKEDLPSIIENTYLTDHPDGSPPTPSQVSLILQKRLDNKIPDDYITDIGGIDPGTSPSIKYGTEFDWFISANIQKTLKRFQTAGKSYELDNHEMIIYHDDQAQEILKYIKAEFDSLIIRLEAGEINKNSITKHIDELLFSKYRVSMLSDGFREFYIYKHTILDQ